jgi:hypothetical protein
MAARRKYSDEQRERIFRLHRRGHNAADIARMCAGPKEGTTVEPFEIPRRSVADIIGRMERERRGQPNGEPDHCTCSGSPTPDRPLEEIGLHSDETAKCERCGEELGFLTRAKIALELHYSLPEQCTCSNPTPDRDLEACKGGPNVGAFCTRCGGFIYRVTWLLRVKSPVPI